MARARELHAQLTDDTLAGAIKLAADARGMTLAELAPVAGMKPDSLRGRLCKSRGKRALQPWQVTAIAQHLGLSEARLHRLAAAHEGWKLGAPEGGGGPSTG